jgi:hypothetical protein
MKDVPGNRQPAVDGFDGRTAAGFRFAEKPAAGHEAVGEEAVSVLIFLGGCPQGHDGDTEQHRKSDNEFHANVFFATVSQIGLK